MSSRKIYKLSLSDEAIEDFRDILSYTMQMWGEQQVEEYSTILHKALIDIEQTPLMGKGDLSPYRHVTAGKHIVFLPSHRGQGTGFPHPAQRNGFCQTS